MYRNFGELNNFCNILIINQMDNLSFAIIFLSFQWTYGRGRCMMKLLDIPDSWFARFMFKRSLDAAANEMEQQAYMQGKVY